MMYISLYIYIYIKFVTETVRTLFIIIVYGFRRRHHPTLFYGFRRWLFDAFRRRRKHFLWFPSLVFFMVSVVAGKHFFMASVAGLLVDLSLLPQEDFNFRMYRAIARLFCF